MRNLTLMFALVLTVTNMQAASLDKLTKGELVDGFRTDAVYLDDGGRPIGARFTHRRSGFTLDYLQIESVPQGFTWVNSIPVSDQGEFLA